MDSITNKPRSVEKRYRDKLKKNLKNLIIYKKNIKNKIKKLEKVKKIIISTIINYKKQKNQQNYK